MLLYSLHGSSTTGSYRHVKIKTGMRDSIVTVLAGLMPCISLVSLDGEESPMVTSGGLEVKVIETCPIPR